MENKSTEKGGPQLVRLDYSLNHLDELLIEKAEAAIREYRRQHPLPIGYTDADAYERDRGLPMSEDGLLDQLFCDSELILRSNYGPADLVRLLGSSLQRWGSTSRNIVYLYRTDCESNKPLDEWLLWTKQVYNATVDLMSKTVMCIDHLNRTDVLPVLEHIVGRLACVDDLLDLLPQGKQKRVMLERELGDTLLAVKQMKSQGIESFDNKAIDVFKASIRAHRATIDATKDEATLPLQATANEPDSSRKSAETISQIATESWKPTVMGATLLLTIASTYFLVQGWQLSTHENGKSSDADYWFLWQSSIMQWVSALPIVAGFLTDPVQNRQVHWWIWILLGASLVCAIAAPVSYLISKTEASAMISFFGCAAQAFVVLEAMFVTEPVRKLKAS